MRWRFLEKHAVALPKKTEREALIGADEIIPKCECAAYRSDGGVERRCLAFSPGALSE
jgi:hypothetical protein